MNQIGITERGDPSLSHDWIPWVNSGNPAILITKDPTTLLKILETGKWYDPNIIVHCTITGHGNSIVEPNVPSPEQALLGYKALITALGTNRVVLR